VTEHRFVFIAGLHRSGTSLLARCLSEHPLISGFRDTSAPEEEGQHLQSVYPSGNAFGGPGIFGFDPNAALNETSPLVSVESGRQLMREWSPHWDLKCPVLLEKSPPNLIRTRFLQALFPGCLFVVMLRHPIVVAHATQKWSGTTLESLVEHWIVCHERFRADHARLQSVLVYNYEAFARDPQQVIDSIYAFIGVPPHPNSVAVRADDNDRYFAHWHELMRTSPEAGSLIARCEARVQSLGYSLRTAGPCSALGSHSK
jgi:hypothetical protein